MLVVRIHRMGAPEQAIYISEAGQLAKAPDGYAAGDVVVIVNDMVAANLNIDTELP